MGRDDASCAGDKHLFEGVFCFNSGDHRIDYFLAAARVSDKHAGAIDIFLIGKPFLNIGKKNVAISAAILFANAHAAVLNLNARLELKKIGAKSRNA